MLHLSKCVRGQADKLMNLRPQQICVGGIVIGFRKTQHSSETGTVHELSSSGANPALHTISIQLAYKF